MLNNKKLKEKAKTLEPVIRIGKNGLTESTIKEIKKQLNKKKAYQGETSKGIYQ